LLPWLPQLGWATPRLTQRVIGSRRAYAFHLMGCGSSRAIRVAPAIPGANKWKVYEPDQYSARFIDLVDDAAAGFHFVESCCFNKKFDPHHVYVPVQHTDLSCHIYKVDFKNGTKAEWVLQVVKNDGETELSPFGTALSDDGVLWLCCFNENMLVALDLKGMVLLAEVKCPAPNDVCLSRDGKYVYAGCGSWLGKIPVAAGKGTIWRAETRPPYSITKVANNCQGTMAGVAEENGQVYCAHLQRMTVYGKPGPSTAKAKVQGARQIWTGYCSHSDASEKVGKYYLADNLSWWDDETRDVLFTPCYRYLAGGIGALLDRYAKLSAIGWGAARALTMFNRLREEGIDAVARVNDDGLSPEVDLSFSKGDVFEHAHLSLMNVRTRATANYVFKLNAAVQGHDYDGHITHVEHVGDGLIVCVNFLMRKLLIIDGKGLVQPP